jgi:hypothetical protein
MLVKQAAAYREIYDAFRTRLRTSREGSMSWRPFHL